MHDSAHAPDGSGDRARQLDELLKKIVRRRGAGERLRDDEIIAAHPELLPELAEQLRVLRRIDRAERDAEEGQARPASPVSPSGMGMPNEQIPGVQILEEIHRGGQATVYRGVQRSTGRQVAVKIMHARPFSALRDRARFKREVRILGQFQHPNIVTIHDSGVTEAHSYFVMDYVSGQPLDRYTAAVRPDLRDILGLFVKVCRAVNAAHLRGITHRDLKPANILIDEQGEPRILDFGLAKLAQDEDNDLPTWRTVTETGQFLGSLPWSSPEQVSGSPSRIDSRTDVYSLGVILYVQLTGHFPYEISGHVHEVADRIVRHEPVRPGRVQRASTPILKRSS